MPITMGERIKYLRESKGMTQEELGKKIGVQKSAILKYENGSIENIKRSSIKIMADLFEVSPTYLMAWDEDEQKLNNISEEVKLIESIQRQYGNSAIELLSTFAQLNKNGQVKVIEYAHDLNDVPKYMKEESK